MTWFEEVFGFDESAYSPTQIRTDCFDTVVDSTGVTLLRVKVGSLVGKTYRVGSFETCSTATLFSRLSGMPPPPSDASPLSFSNLTADVRTLHHSSACYSNYGLPSPVVIQAASQFNALEMVGPTVTPSHGVTVYIRDRTQGPAW